MSHTIQMIHKTAIDGMGIFQLGMVPDFFKKMKIPISDIKVEGEFFDLDRYQNPNFRREFISNNFKFKYQAYTFTPGTFSRKWSYPVVLSILYFIS